MRRQRLITTILILLAPATTHAWNYTGHRVIASIAYRQLDDQTRRKVAEALKKHPAYASLWAHRTTNGPDELLNLFWNASVFPDDARSEPWQKYGRGLAHYVNYRIRGNQGNKVEPPVEGENVLNSYVAHLAQIRSARTPIEEKALHLSWVFHQAGDIHQPLHAVARFSKALPEGDRGGNGVTFPSPRGRGDFSGNLHAYWDGLLGSDQNPAAVEKLADELAKEYPRERFVDDLEKTNIRDWAEESVQIALKTVYHDLDPEITRFVDIPVGYEADARTVARRRVALAGYRLAEELKRLFPGDGTSAREEPTYARMPWHLVDIWWDTGKDRPFESLSVDVTISADVPSSVNLYISPIGLGHLSKTPFYGGIQTRADGYTRKDQRLRQIGPGLLFSMWGERSVDAIRPSEGGFFQSSGHEGDFVSVRRPFAWKKGKFTYRLCRMDQQTVDGRPSTWVGAFVYCHEIDENLFVGALRFPGENLVIDRKVANFVEVYGQHRPVSEIPKVTVTFGAPVVNGVAEDHPSAVAIYPKGVPDYADTVVKDGSLVVTVGQPVEARKERRVNLLMAKKDPAPGS